MTPMFSFIRVTLHWLDRPSGTTHVWNELEHKISSLRAFRSIAKGAASVLYRLSGGDVNYESYEITPMHCKLRQVAFQL